MPGKETNKELFGANGKANGRSKEDEPKSSEDRDIAAEYRKYILNGGLKSWRKPTPRQAEALEKGGGMIPAPIIHERMDGGVPVEKE